MSPRIANKDRGELPKPQVNIGALGFSPVNPLTLSYRYQGMGDVLLHIPDETVQTENTHWVHQRSDIQVIAPDKSKKEKAAEPLPVNGKLLKGLSDALYRGKLPQVLICAPHVTQFNAWLNEISEYIEKTLQFGFFLQHDPIEHLFPNIVLVSDGVFFKRLIQALSQLLERHPGLTPEWREQLLSKCHRGILLDDAGEPVTLPLDLTREPVSLMQGPMRIRLAAQDVLSQSTRTWRMSPYLSTVESLLTLQGFQVQVENSVPSAVERLELEYALLRASSVIVPALESVTETTKEPPLQTRFWNAIVRIGQQLLAFENEPGALPSPAAAPKAAKKKSAAVTVPTVGITANDMTIVDSLRHYAAEFSLTEEQAMFEQANRDLLTQLQQQ